MEEKKTCFRTSKLVRLDKETYDQLIFLRNKGFASTVAGTIKTLMQFCKRKFE